MVLETDTITILIDYFTGIVHCGILIHNDRHRFEHIHEKHAEKYPNQEGQELQMIKEFHFPYL
jgi:hypothetical protein